MSAASSPPLDIRPRVLEYISQGLSVLPANHRTKKVTTPGWPTKTFSESDFHAGSNAAIRLGADGLADVDLDCEEARILAPHFLPDTGFIFGRSSARASHWFYNLEPAIPSIKRIDPVIGNQNEGTIIELRCTTAEGGIGFYTIVPGSIHEGTGEPIEFESGATRMIQNADADEIVAAVNRIAAIVLLKRHFPPEKKGRNDAFLAIAGTLARAGWSEADAVEFNFGIYRLIWGDAANRRECVSEVKPTFTKYAAGSKLLGIPTLKETMNVRAVSAAFDWLGIGSADTDRVPPPPSAAPDPESVSATEIVELAIKNDDPILIWENIPAFALLDLDQYELCRYRIKEHFQNRIKLTGLDKAVAAKRAEQHQSSPSTAIPPNNIALAILAKHSILNVSDNLFIYEKNKWVGIQQSQLQNFAMTADGELHTTKNRRIEIGDFISKKIYKSDHKWRQIEMYEVPVQNGVIDVRSMAIRPHRKEDYLQTCIPWPYRPEAQCPELMRCLDTYFGGDDDGEAKIAALQEFFGYCLMPHARYKKALLCVGESDCGKSTIPFLLRTLLGGENVAAVGVEHMDDERKRAPLLGKLVNLLTELTSDAMIADGGFKTLVSTEEPILFDPKHKAPVMDVPICKHVIVTNTKPRISDKSNGTFRRLLLIHFNHVIPQSEQDTRVWDKLRDEVGGILSWAVEGAVRLYQNGGRFTDPGAKEITEYRNDQNPMKSFLDNCCDVDPTEKTITSHFIDRFRAFNSSRLAPNTILQLARDSGFVIDVNPTASRNGKKYRHVNGLKIQ